MERTFCERGVSQEKQLIVDSGKNGEKLGGKFMKFMVNAN